MFKNLKSVVVGMIIGGMLVSGVGYASTYISKIEVSVEPIKFTYDHKEITPENNEVPASFIYKGTTYVPLRFIGEAVNKEVLWNPKTRTIGITDGTVASRDDYQELFNADFQRVNFDEENKEVPKEIREWANANYKTEYQGYKTVNGETYILLARGQSSTSGYGIEVTGITKSATQATVKAKYINPDPGGIYLQVITYPVVLLKVDQSFDKISFEINKIEDKTNRDM